MRRQPAHARMPGGLILDCQLLSVGEAARDCTGALAFSVHMRSLPQGSAGRRLTRVWSE